MSLSSGRWKRYAESKYPHEREALEYLRENLPDSDPVLLYSNFEFIADDGSVNEIDALVVTRVGLFLVEIKSRGGKIAGNRHTWSWEQEGRVLTIDSPLILANSKARKLGDLLERQKAFKEIKRPYVEALVFCSDPSISIQLAESERMRVCARLPLDKAPGIIPALLRRESPGITPLAGTVIDKPVARAIVQALEQAGIRHSQRERRVGDYVLTDLIEENSLLSCQDFAAEHPSTKTPRRVRLYNVAAAEPGERERIKEAAKREYLILDGLDHPGIVKALDFREHELGPAIIFRRERDEVRLDHYLAQEGHRLTLDQRLDLTNRDIALIEQPEYKRRWNLPKWEDLERKALEDWLLDRMESAALWADPELKSCSRLADLLRRDPEFAQVAELAEGRPDYEIAALVKRLTLKQAVPFLPVLRYKPSGLEKRREWEKTWELQRREDGGEKVEILVPPKYRSADFQDATWWSLRGSLDVPKERFILYSGLEGTSDSSPVIGWAGWDHLKQAQALTAYYQHVKEQEGLSEVRLKPALAGLLELIPWLKQWHNESDPATGERMGESFAAFLEAECQELGITVDSLQEWMPARTARAGRRRG